MRVENLKKSEIKKYIIEGREAPSSNSWELGGALSSPGEVRGTAPENFQNLA